jgi:GDP-L-fucose synthase
LIDLTQSRVLVTGGNGFLGKHVVSTLEREGVHEISAPRSSEYDLRDRDAVRACIADSRPDIIIHLAAVVGGIMANRRNGGRFFYDNAIMGIELLEQARLAGVPKTVLLGTVCAYPKHTPVPFREDDLWNGYPEEVNAAYGLAKKVLLVQAQAYRQQYGYNAIYLMPVNLYGPGDNFDLEDSHVIPALIRKFLEAKSQGRERVVVWGTGSASREFLYVADAARGIVAAARLYDGREPINLGSGGEITIRDLAETIGHLCGFQGSIEWDTSQPDGQPRRQLDTSRARDLLGFQAEVGLETGLKATIDWYLASEAAQPAIHSTGPA